MEILGFDIEQAFVPDVSVVEIVLRGSIVYLVLFVVMKVVLRRKSGGVAFTDLLVLVLIADASQNAMAAEYHSIADGLLLAGTLIFWSYALDWLAFRVPAIGRFVHPPKLPLIEDGRIVRGSLRQELLMEDELMTQLRLQGVEKVVEVRAAFMEGNGQVSVLRKEKSEQSGGRAANGPLPG